MKKIATTLIVMMSVSVAYAESELNQFIVDLDKYNAAQRQTPTHLIQYRDKNGYLLKNLYNPERIEPLMQDSFKNNSSVQKLNILFKKITPIGPKYGTAFRAIPKTYDREYLDIVDVYYRMVILMCMKLTSPEMTKEFNAQQKGGIKALTNTLYGNANFMLSKLEKEINSGAFSPQYTTQAIARLESLKQFKRTISAQSASSHTPGSVTPQETVSTYVSATLPSNTSTSVVPPQLWSSHLQLNMQASACASKGYSVLSTLGMSSIVQNDTYVYGNYDSSRIAVKCVPMNDQSFVYIAVAGPSKEVAERLRNDIFYRMK